MSKSSTVSPRRISSRYQRLIRDRIRKTRPWDVCIRAWMLENTTAPCSINAWVVPTGVFELTSAIFSSAVVTTPLAALFNQPKSSKSTGLGGLNGSGMATLRMSSTPGAASISVTCVISMFCDWPEIFEPFNFSAVSELLVCAVSKSALKAPVKAADKPPIRCGRPIA